MTRILVQHLPCNTIERDAEDLFARYGSIVLMQMRFGPQDPPYAIVEYAEVSQSERACEELDGLHYSSKVLRAELLPPIDVVLEKTQHCISLSNLPPSATAKEVKDFILKRGDAMNVQVDRRGNATAWFPTSSEMKHTLSMLDGSEFRGEKIRAKRDNTVDISSLATTTASSRRSGEHSSTHSRPRSPARRSSRSRSPQRARRRSASPSRTKTAPRRDRRSPSRSPRPRRRSRSRSRSR